MNAVAYVLVIIGALNWGLVGISSNLDLVQLLIGSWAGDVVARIIYIVVGLAALWLIFAKKGNKAAPAPSSPMGDSQM